MLTSRLASFLSQTVPPTGLVKTMSAIGRPGVQAILPLEASVIAGRSGNEARRSGFLGFQERFIEEVVVAAVWLWGVNTLGKFFDKFHNVDTAIDWSAQKLKSVDLTPLERYTPNAKAIDKVMRLKGMRLGFSVITTLFILGIVIPWLNQLKTKWIIEKYFHPKHPAKPKNPSSKPQQPTQAPRQMAQPALSPEQLNSLFATRPALAVLPPSKSNRIATSPPRQQMQPTVSWNPPPSAYSYTLPSYSPQTGWPYAPIANVPPPPQLYSYPQLPYGPTSPGLSPRFGGGKGMGSSLLSTAGHWIENTDYGSILVTDAGIMAGRCTVASRRSPYEALEIMFRDGASIYFYVMAVPHLMQLMDKILKPALNAATRMDPAAAHKINDYLLQAATRSKSPLTLARVRSFIEGSSLVASQVKDPALAPLVNSLSQTLRSAPLQEGTGGFLPLLQKEVLASFESADRAKKIFGALLQLASGNGTAEGNAARIAAPEIAKLIEQVQTASANVQSPLGQLYLETHEKTDLVRALKNAFRHTAGASESVWSQTNGLSSLMEKLSTEEKANLRIRMRWQAEQDTMELVNSMLRRCLLLSENTLPQLKHQRAELLATWVEHAANRKIPFYKVLEEEIAAIVPQLEKLPASASPDIIKAAHTVREILSKKTLPTSAESFSILEKGLRELNQKSWTQMANQLNLLEFVFLQEKSFREASKSIINLVASELAAASKHATAKPLIEHYQQSLQSLLSREGQRMFSLFTEKDSPEVSQKIEEMLVGGLQRSSRLVREAMHLVGSLKHDSKLYPHPEKIGEMEHIIADYFQTFLKHLTHDSPALLKEGQALSQEAFRNTLSRFALKSQNSRMLAQGIAFPLTMIGLGILVPKLQFLLTKVLTGKNTHPGIAAVNHAVESEGNAGENPPQTPYIPLNRNRLQAFQKFQTLRQAH